MQDYLNKWEISFWKKNGWKTGKDEREDEIRSIKDVKLYIDSREVEQIINKVEILDSKNEILKSWK